MTSDELWRYDGEKYDWLMPSATWWKRLYGVRHVRAFIVAIAVECHYAAWPLPSARTGYDEWVIYGIGRGFEKPMIGETE